MHARMVSVIATMVLGGCGGGLGGAPPEREPGRTHAGLYDEWVGEEERAGRSATGEGEGELKPAGAVAGSGSGTGSGAESGTGSGSGTGTGAETTEAASEAGTDSAGAGREGRRAERGEDRVSNVGEALPVRVEQEGQAAAAECVCEVEPEVVDAEVLREEQERARYRQPMGTATRVAGGPPEGFERPPGSDAQYGHAWAGGFERAPGTAAETAAPDDTGPSDTGPNDTAP